ncbi:MAG: CRTAC1 family protein [Planctomycetota bacterium]
MRCGWMAAGVGLCVTSGLGADGGFGGGFVDVTPSSGISSQFRLPPTQEIVGMYFMGGGVSPGDFNGDGNTDLFLTRYDQPDQLYLNNGDGTFTDTSVTAGFIPRTNTIGSVAFDADNDGDLDLYVTTAGAQDYRFLLYINDGNAVFTEEAVARNAAVETTSRHLGTSPAAGDFDSDGCVDLYVTEWGTSNRNKLPDDPRPLVTHARLLRNLCGETPGYFEDVTIAAGLDAVELVDSINAENTEQTLKRFSPRFSDLDVDGDVDLFIGGDFLGTMLFWNNGDGTFTNAADLGEVFDDENGMGCAIGDLDGDLIPEVFVTSIWDPRPDEVLDCSDPATSCNWGKSGNRLYQYDGVEGGTWFQDATDVFGLRIGWWGWATTFFDFDNDADQDVFMTNGFSVTGASDQPETLFHTDPNVLWENPGDGTAFIEVAQSLGITDVQAGKGLAAFDAENDGDLDLIIVNNPGTAVMYRNDAAAGGWLRVDLVGTTSNSFGLGARVILTPTDGGQPQLREVNASSHYLSHDEVTAHFGLGDHIGSVHELRVEWPSGIVQAINGLQPNERCVVVEPTCDRPGDTDGDFDVDTDDFIAVLVGFGSQTLPGDARGGDIVNFDGEVNTADFVAVLVAFGTVCD